MSARPTVPWRYRVLAWPLLALAHLPLPLLYILAKGLYWLLAYLIRYRQKVVVDNLRHAFPEKSSTELQRITRQFYWHFAQVLVEIVKLAAISPAELTRRMCFTNPEVLGQPLREKRLVLALGSHMGNWEWILSRAAQLFPGQAAGVYKKLTSEFFEYYTRRLRTRLGADAVTMASTLRYLIQHRGQGRVLGLLIDQAAGSDDRPYWTDFLHREAGFYTSADRLAEQFNCVVLYIGIRRVRRGYYDITFTNLFDGATRATHADSPDEAQRYLATEGFVRQLEADIRATPAHYLWTHRRWKHKRATGH